MEESVMQEKNAETTVTGENSDFANDFRVLNQFFVEASSLVRAHLSLADEVHRSTAISVPEHHAVVPDPSTTKFQDKNPNLFSSTLSVLIL
jgi:hypothetical protein